jgi:hypothetical protein
MQLRSGRRDLDTSKDRPLTPYFIVSVARGPEVQKVRSLPELCGLRVSVESYVATKRPFQCKRCQCFGNTQRNCGYAPRCVACGEAHLSGERLTPEQQLKCCSYGGNHTANYRGYSKWKEAKAALAKQVPIQCTPISGAAGQPAAKWSRQSHPRSRRALGLVGTTMSEEVVLLMLSSQPFLNPLQGRSQTPQQDKMTQHKTEASLPTRYSKPRRPSGRPKWRVQRWSLGNLHPRIEILITRHHHLNPSSDLSRSAICSTPYPWAPV